MRKERERKEKLANGVKGASTTLEKRNIKSYIPILSSVRNINRLFDSPRHRECMT